MSMQAHVIAILDDEERFRRALTRLLKALDCQTGPVASLVLLGAIERACGR